MPRRERVLLVYSHYSSFVKNDHRILEDAYEVERFQLRWQPGMSDRLRETYLGLWNAIRRNDRVLWWFLSDYCAIGALFARLQRKRFVAIAGGWDVAAEKKTGYGRLISGWLPRTSTKVALRLADCVLTVSPFNDAEAVAAGRKGPRKIVPNGVDVDRFKPAESLPQGVRDSRPVVVAVGAVSRHNHDVKGQWIFAETSKRVPEADFYLIGGADPEVAKRLTARGGPNLKITGYVADDDLLSILQRAKVVTQLSWHESFGMGLVEAVSCGCAPVYSDERVGAVAYLEDLGHPVPYGDSEAAARAIRCALADAAAPDYRARAHEVIRRNIPLRRRRDELLGVMGGPTASRRQSSMPQENSLVRPRGA